MFSCRAMMINVKKSLYEGVAVPTIQYGAETWSMAVAEKKRLKVMEMRCVCEVMSMVDRVRNEEV